MRPARRPSPAGKAERNAPSARILYCQATGGGGSVGALQTLIESLDRRVYDPVVLFYREPEDAAPFRAADVRTVVLDSRTSRGKRAIWAREELSGVADSVPIMTLRQARRLLRADLPRARRIAEVARRLEVDLIHSNVHPFADRAAALAAGLVRKPLVAHVRMDRRHWRTIDGPLSAFVDAYVYVSDAVRRRFEQDVPGAKGRGTVIYDPCSVPGVEGSARSGVRRELGLPDRSTVLANVGTLVPRKGHDLFLEAVSRLVPRHPDVRALVVGGASQEGEEHAADLRVLARKLGIEDRVKFTGHRSDAHRIMAASDLCVMSSRGPEGLPLVVVEAMLAGCPVVATDVGGTAEVVHHGETGLLVPADDADALARALGESLQEPASARRRAERASRQARRMFSARTHAGRVQSLYGAILADRPLAATRSA